MGGQYDIAALEVRRPIGHMGGMHNWHMTLRHSEKHTRYTQLKIVCEANGWKVHALCVEVGCRGHMSQSFEWMCEVLGLTKEERKEPKYEVEKTTLHCSHAIVPARYLKEWIPKPLLDMFKWS